MKNKKTLWILILMLIVGIVGATVAYFTSTATLNNEFKTGIYSTIVTEVFTSPTTWVPGDVTPKQVNVVNKGTVDIAVRAKFTESWTASDGTNLDLTRDGEKLAQFTTGSDWELATDGYYYYKDILSANDVSTDFITSVTFNPNFELEEGADIECTESAVDGTTTSKCTSLKSGYAGATYRLSITIETIQSDQKWDYAITPDEPIYATYEIGDEITIANEIFNVIKDNGDTVTMLAKYNLGTNYKQNSVYNAVKFSNEVGWTPGENINIQLYDGPVKTYVNEYVLYLREKTGDTTLSGTLITNSQLEALGCEINDDDGDCSASKYSSWLLKTHWHTRTSHVDDSTYVWRVNADGMMYYGSINHSSNLRAVRPVITISKSALANL